METSEPRSSHACAKTSPTILPVMFMVTHPFISGKTPAVSSFCLEVLQMHLPGSPVLPFLSPQY